MRAKLQQAMGRPIALEDVQSMTIGQVKALEGTDDPAAAAASAAEAETAADPDAKQTVSLPGLPCIDIDANCLHLRAMCCSACLLLYLKMAR